MPGIELYSLYNLFRKQWGGFPGGSVAKNLPANARDTGSVIPDLEEPTCHGAAQSVRHNY